MPNLCIYHLDYWFSSLSLLIYLLFTHYFWLIYSYKEQNNSLQAIRGEEEAAEWLTVTRRRRMEGDTAPAAGVRLWLRLRHRLRHAVAVCVRGFRRRSRGAELLLGVLRG
jgi:hypothetical protein